MPTQISLDSANGGKLVFLQVQIPIVPTGARISTRAGSFLWTVIGYYFSPDFVALKKAYPSSYEALLDVIRDHVNNNADFVAGTVPDMPKVDFPMPGDKVDFLIAGDNK
jgi:hypothetical protein